MKVGEIINYSPDQTITYGGLNGLSAITSAAVAMGARDGKGATDVMALQTWLKKVGYPINPDGQYGPKTAMAVLFVQRKLNNNAQASVVPENGQWDAATNARASAQTQSDLVQPNQEQRNKVEAATSASFADEIRGVVSNKQPGTTVAAKDTLYITPSAPPKPVQGQPAQPGQQPGAVPPESFMDKAKRFVQEHPALAAGYATAGVFALYLLFSSKPPAASAPQLVPAMAGIDGWDMPKRKKRRSKRKSKK